MGVGKTTLASQFEKSLICGFEMGYGALDDIMAVPIKTWRDWKDYVKQLTRNPELQSMYEVVTVDTSDEAYKLCEKYVCNKYGAETIKDVAGYGGGYKILDDEFMTPFRDLAFAGYGLVFISHETEKVFKDDRGQEYNKIVPALPSRPLNLINKMVDTIGYIRDFSIEGADGVPTHKRMLFFRGDDRFLAKSRFKYIVPQIELSYDAYLKAIYDAIDKQAEVHGHEASRDDITQEQTFEELMEDAKLIWTKVVNAQLTQAAAEILEKEFGKPIKFSEILPEQKEQLKNVIQEMRDLV